MRREERIEENVEKQRQQRQRRYHPWTSVYADIDSAMVVMDIETPDVGQTGLSRHLSSLQRDEIDQRIHEWLRTSKPAQGLALHKLKCLA